MATTAQPNRPLRAGTGSRGPLLLLTLLLSGPTTATEAVAEAAHYQRLVREVATAAEAERRAFAWIALEELTLAYDDTLQRSGERGLRDPKHRAKLGRWQQQSAEFVSRLHGMLAGVSAHSAVAIEPSAAGRAAVIVDRMPMVIEGPNIEVTREIEQRISERYCLLTSCDYAAEAPPEPKQSRRPRPPSGLWSYGSGQNARFEIEHDFVCEFPDLRQRQEREAQCGELAVDLLTIETKLRDLTRVGFQIEWPSLTLRPTEAPQERELLFNHGGEYARVEVVILGDRLPLSETMRGWLQARLDGSPFEPLPLPAWESISLASP